jgi:hypothetical protein
MSAERVEALLLRWYERRGPGIVPRWLAAAREHLPEALPVRFGESEPLRHRFVSDADLVAAHSAADPLLFLRCTRPVHDVALGSGPNGGPVQAHTLHALTPRTRRRSVIQCGRAGSGSRSGSASGWRRSTPSAATPVGCPAACAGGSPGNWVAACGRVGLDMRH